jgi:hypothetical protein
VVDEDGRIIRTLVFQLDEVLLDGRELNALLGEPHAWDSLYNNTDEEPVPFLKCFKSLEFEKSIDTATAVLFYGLDEVVQSFAGVTLSKIKLALRDGGMTAMSCKVRTAPTLDETLAQLFEHFGNPIECELILLPPGAQQELPLNTHGIGEQVDQARPKLKGRGRGKGRDGAILQ